MTTKSGSCVRDGWNLTGANTLARALLAFQAEGVKLQKNAINPHFRNAYISLDSLIESVLPIANDCGVVVLQLPTSVDGVPSLTTRLLHAESGEQIEATMPLQLEKPGPQAQGSAITYARRYALMAMLGLVADEDTDGSAAGTAEPARRTRRKEAASGSAASDTGTRYATEAQRKRLFAIAKEHGVEGPRLKEIVEHVTGQGSTAQIPADQYDAVVKAVELEAVPFE